MISNPDAQTMAELRLGNDGALAAMVTSYGPHIRQQALRYVRSPEDAEEIAQDVLVKVWRKLHAFRGDAAFSSWVHRITFNTAMSRLRNRRISRPLEVSVDTPRPGSGRPLRSSALDAVDWSGMADELVLRREMRRRLQQAIALMPAIYRVPVVMRDIEGRSIDEVSTLLNLNKQTLKSRVHRGRQFLRRRLGAFSGGLTMHRRPPTLAPYGRTFRP